jgi:hypothetical protein
MRYTIACQEFTRFSAAVLASAVALGLSRASACLDACGYYVIYRPPHGHLLSTEATHSEKAALYAFEKAVYRNILLGQ